MIQPQPKTGLMGIRQRSLRKHCKLGRATELVFVLATGTALSIGGSANAQQQTWDGGSQNWNTFNPNWGGAAFINGNGAIFNDANDIVTITEGTDNGGATIVAGGIQFFADNITIAASGAADTLTLTGDVVVSTGNTASISANIVSGLTNNSAGTLIIGGDVTGAVSNIGAGELTLSGANYGALTNATGTTTVGSGSAASLVNTSGTTTVTGGAVTGTTTINAGSVVVNGTDDATLELLGATTVNTGGSLTLTNGDLGGLVNNGDAGGATEITITDGDVVSIDHNSGETDVNGGQVTGAVFVDGGAVTIDDAQVGSIDNNTGGDVDLGGAVTVDSTITNAAALNINTGTTTASGGTTNEGGGILTIDSGATLTSNLTNQGSAQFINNGTLNGDVTVLGGTLGGSGTVGAITATGGVIAPGNSIGTLSVNGDVTLSSGATHEVELDDAGNADLIAATGRAVINNAALSVLADTTGTYTGPSPTYKIITADGGVSGQYASVSDTLPDVDFEVTYGAQEVTLRYVDPSQSSAATGTGGATTTTSSGGTSPKEVHAASVMGAAGASLGFNGSLVKGGFGQSGGGRGQASRLSFDALGAPLSLSTKGAVAQRDWTVWATGFGQRLSVDTQGVQPAWQASTGGSVLGLDLGVEAGGPTIATLALGFSNTRVTSGLSSTAIKSTHVGAGLAWQRGPASISAGLSYGRQTYDTTRVIPIGAGFATAKGQTQGTTLAASLAASYEMPSSTDSFRWGPMARLDWTRASYDSYSETGAGILNLNVAGARATQSVVTLGVTATKHIKSRAGSVSLKGALAWEHTAGNRSATSRSTLLSTGGAFSAASAPIDANRLLVSLGADIALAARSSAFVAYEARLGAQSTEHSASIGFAMKF